MNRQNRQAITAFYIEMLVLILVFTGVILTLTRMFAIAKQQSGEAWVLTRAVRLAENAAELQGAAGGPEELLELLDRGNAEKSGEGVVRAWYGDDMEPSREGDFCVAVSWKQRGGLAESVIDVYWLGGEEPVYSLSTAAFVGGGAG